MKRISSYIHYKYFLSLLIIHLSSLHAFAQWNGGNGTVGNPYQIATAAQLKLLADSVNAGKPFTNVYFKLTNNVNLNGTNWTPVGTSARPFRGNFDGSNLTVSGLFISRSMNDVGLFGYMTGGTISNLGVITTPGGVTGTTNVGILLGNQNGGTVTGCFTMGTVAGNDAVGGLIGNQVSVIPVPVVSQCFAIVDVTGGAGLNGAAGLIGIVRGNLNNSYAWGDVRGAGSVSGLGGALSNNGVVNSCYALGNAASSPSSRIGGLVGFLTQSTASLQNSVAINGTLTSVSTSIGRVFGQTNHNTFTNNHAIDSMVLLLNGAKKSVTSSSTGMDGETQTKATLKSSAFYGNTVLWNISNVNDGNKIWNIWEGVSYPYLQRQSSPANPVSFSGTTLQGTFRPDVSVDSIVISIKNGTSFTRLGIATVNNAAHTWSFNSSSLIMNGIVYVQTYESGKAWPSYPVDFTICGITPTFETVDKTSCIPAINLQTAITNLQNADIKDVQFSKAGGAAFDANIIPSPATYATKGTEIIYARVTTSIGCQSVIKSFQVKTTGTLMFREDFGSIGNPGSGDCSTTPLGPTVTSYTFGGDLHINGRYGLCAQLSNYYADYFYIEKATYDHTDPGKGRSLIVNADFDPGQFYKLRIDNLCPGTRLYFSSWVFNLVNPNASATNFYLGQGVTFNNPDLRLEVRDANTNELLEAFSTGGIPMVTDPAANWRPYGFDFTVGSSSAVTLTLINNAPGGNGNDLMIDDIEVYLCLPPVSIVAPTQFETTICGNDNITLTGTYTDDGTLGNNLAYNWLRSTTGNVNNPADWTVVASGTSSNPLNVSYNIANMQASDDGYYRLVVGTPGSINQYNCIAKSNTFKLTYKPRVDAANINATGTTTICSGTNTTLTANITGITVTNPIYKWYDSPSATVPVFTGKIYQTPNLTATTTYYIGILGDNYCETPANNRKVVTVTVVPLPVAADILSVNGADICAGNTAVLTANPASGFVARWYADAALTNFLFEGNSYTTPVLNESKTYHVVAKTILGNCIGEPASATPVTATVNPSPVADFEYSADNNPFVINFTDISTISSGNIVAWQWDFGDDSTSTFQNPQHQYDLPEADHTVRLIVTGNTGCSDTITYVIHVGKTPYAKFSVNEATQCLDGNTFEFINLSSISVGEIPQTTYLWTFGDGNQSSQEHPVHHYASAGTFTVKLLVNMAGLLDSTTTNITVNPSPTLFSKMDTTICTGQSVSLYSLIIQIVNNPAVFYADKNGSPLANITVSPTDTTQYYILVTDLATMCQSWDSVTINVNALPSLLGKRDTIVCAGQPVDLNTLVTLEPNTTAAFYTSINGTLISPAVVNPMLSTQYYVKITESTTTCEAWDSVTVNANPLPTQFEIISITDNSACYGTSTVLFAATASDDFVPQWYSDPALTDLLFEGNGFLTPTLTDTTIFYVVAKNSLTGCRANPSEAKQAVATMNPLPVSSDILELSPAVSCGESAVTLTAYYFYPGFVARWYADAELTNFLFEGDNFNTPFLTTTTTYYVAVRDSSTGCIGNAETALPAVATIYPLPTINDITSVTGAAVCGQGSVTLTATPASGFAVRWYADSTLNTFLLEGNSYTTPVLNTTTTYYVAAKNDTNTCISLSSSALPVVATVNRLPQNSDFRAITSTSVCKGKSAGLFAAVEPGFVPRWYSDSALTNFLFEGNSFITPPLDTTTIYYIVPKDTTTGCIGLPSAAATATATVNPLPTASLNIAPEICQGDSVALVITLTGQSPWTVEFIYGTGATHVTERITTSPYQYFVHPDQTTTYTLIRVRDGNSCEPADL